MSDFPLSVPGALDQYYVTVHNDLIMGRFEWSIAMHRILMVLISQLDSRGQKRFKPQFVRVHDLIRLTNQKRGAQYRQAKKAVQRLVHQAVEMETEDGSWQGVPLFGYIRYLDHSGIIAAQFSEFARPYLLHLERQFTSWRMDQTLLLRTGYSIRHYMIGKMIQREKRWSQQTLSVKEYRKRLKLEDKYDRFSDLKRRVIAPAVEEVNDQTDVSMKVDVERVSRKPVSITFSVAPPPKNPTPVLHRPQETPSVEPHDKWLGSLSPKEYHEVLEKAERRAEAMGYARASPRTWQAGIEIGLRQIFREQKERS